MAVACLKKEQNWELFFFGGVPTLCVFAVCLYVFMCLYVFVCACVCVCMYVCVVSQLHLMREGVFVVLCM